LKKNDVLYKRGFVDEASLTLNELIRTETGEIKIQALSQLAWIEHRRDDRREAERLFEQSIQLARQFMFPKLEGEALRGLQSIAYFESDYVKAMEYNQKALKVFEQLQVDPEAQASIALIYLDIGGIYREQGLYSEALAAYEKDLEILDTLGDPPYHVGWLDYNMGHALFGQKKWHEAEDRFEDALHYFEKMQHVSGIAHAKIELGRVVSKIDQSRKSVALVEEAMTLFRHIRQTSGEAYGLRALGEVYLNFGEPDHALPYLRQSLEMDEKILHGVKGIASSLHRISLAYEQKAQQLLDSAHLSEATLCFREARSTILRAQALFDQLHTIPNFDGILDDVSRIEQECAE
jgi:tetratricopeptide (TPR) repeat protein